MTQIVTLDRYNWELCLDIRLHPEQEAFLPPVLYSLAQAKFENLIPYGILQGGKMVGFLMYGNFGGICWINRVLIDKDYQQQGIGSAAVRQLLNQLTSKFTCKEIRASYSRDNNIAANFFSGLGFRPMASPLQDEIVAVYQRPV